MNRKQTIAWLLCIGLGILFWALSYSIDNDFLFWISNFLIGTATGIGLGDMLKVKNKDKGLTKSST